LIFHKKNDEKSEKTFSVEKRVSYPFVVMNSKKRLEIWKG